MHLNFCADCTYCNTTIFFITNYTIVLIQQIVKSLVDLIKVANYARDALFNTTIDNINCFIDTIIINIRDESAAYKVLEWLIIILQQQLDHILSIIYIICYYHKMSTKALIFTNIFFN